MLTCQVQRGGVTTLRVAAVDVVGAAELLHAGQAALLGCVQQGGVPAQQVLDVRVSVFDQVQGRVPVPVLLGGVGAVLGENNQNGGVKTRTLPQLQFKPDFRKPERC